MHSTIVHGEFLVCLAAAFETWCIHFKRFTAPLAECYGTVTEMGQSIVGAFEHV